MEILLAYVSVEGLTRQVAARIAEIARESGHLVHLVDISDETLSLTEGTGAVILAAPIHAGAYPDRFEALVRDWAGQLTYTRNALVSVEPARSSGASRDATAAFVANLSAATGWVPGHQHHVAETPGPADLGLAGRLSSWLGLRSATGTADPTDWPALERFTRSFLAEMATS
jgi:menaquinone-dependent protoporphyrinogen oxidase